LQGGLSSYLPQQQSLVDVAAVTKLYNMVFSILNKSMFFPKQQSRMSRFTVNKAPSLLDIQKMLDPLQVRENHLDTLF